MAKKIKQWIIDAQIENLIAGRTTLAELTANSPAGAAQVVATMKRRGIAVPADIVSTHHVIIVDAAGQWRVDSYEESLDRVVATNGAASVGERRQEIQVTGSLASAIARAKREASEYLAVAG